jgi:hypothetical protein
MVSEYILRIADFRLDPRRWTSYPRRTQPKAGRRVPSKIPLVNRKTSMKISRICAFALLFVVGSVMAFADGINDPKIIIQGVNGGASPLHCPPEGCQNVGMNFSFQVPNSGKGFLFFTNTSGKNWTSLALIEKGVPANAISCTQTLFLSCSTKTLHDGSVEILLSGIKGGQNARKGILNGQSFKIGFACLEGSCWPGGLSFEGHAGTVPEPGTVALMVTGLGAIVSRRKRWKSCFKA